MDMAWLATIHILSQWVLIYLMIQIARASLILFILTGLISCTPPEAPTDVPVQATPVAELTTVATPGLELAPLDSAQVRVDLEELLHRQDARTLEEVDLFYKWHSRPVIAWNGQALYWVSYYGVDPVVASRVYAMTSVSQQRALDGLASMDFDRLVREPKALDEHIVPIPPTVDPLESAVLIGATEPVFSYLFQETPKEIEALFGEARRSLLVSGNILPGDLDAAEKFGAEFAQELIADRMDDGASEARASAPLPSGDGIWVQDPYRPRPEQPGWGKVTPWLMDSPDQFRAPPPPEFGSIAFRSALDEVRLQQENNTHEQLAIAQKWADKRFTYTPPGHWNAIAADLVRRYSLSDHEAAQVFSVLNMALMDAGIACWDSKYHYLVVRPWQVDPGIAGLVGYPNHPSYPSGHSCFSGAAAETLSYFFPVEREALWQMAEEASISRLYGGIHYRFDLEAGKELGRQVGELAKLYAVERRRDTSTP